VIGGSGERMWMTFSRKERIVTAYGSNLAVKGLLALVIAWLLVRFGKAKLLAIVLWNGIGLLWHHGLPKLWLL